MSTTGWRCDHCGTELGEGQYPMRACSECGRWCCADCIPTGSSQVCPSCVRLSAVHRSAVVPTSCRPNPKTRTK